MKRLTALAFASGLHLLAPQAALAQEAGGGDQAAHRQQIERVVETFRTALINKDKDAFLKLFLKEGHYLDRRHGGQEHRHALR